jgi:hypothetical protein
MSYSQSGISLPITFSRAGPAQSEASVNANGAVKVSIVKEGPEESNQQCR